MPTYRPREVSGDTLLEKLLHSRGIVTTEDKQAFLNPEYNVGCHDPFLLKDMRKVIDRIKSAIDKNEKITIYSDFDADGIPGAVVLHDCFKKIGYTNFENYIPHRHKEGFGIHIAALDEIAAGGSKLIISIDCGIADVEQAKRAKELNIDLIITDHHTPGSVLPDAFAIINPKQPGCEYPEKMLCGAGVIYKVAHALVKEFGLKEGTEKWWLDMVGIATLSDMVPLVGENRIFAHFGLVVLRKSPRLGLQKLFSSLKINPAYLVEEDITFMVTPRINAASRMADPRDAFILLSTTSETEADEMVRHLNKINDERKVQVAHLVKQINKVIDERYGSANVLGDSNSNNVTDENNAISEKPLIVIGNSDWKPPVLGLAATIIVREQNKPVFLWGRSDEGIIKGSCRSPEGIDIVSIMREVENSICKPGEIFINMGGHSASGGFSITETGIHHFEEKLIEAYTKVMSSKNSMKEESEGALESGVITYTDSYVEPSEVGSSLWQVVSKLAPYGEGNPKPLFLINSAVVENVKFFGKNKEHIEVSLISSKNTDIENNNGNLNQAIINERSQKIGQYGGQYKKPAKAIKFFASEDANLIAKIKVGEKIELVGHMEKSMFKNYPEYRLRIVDVI